MPRLSDLIHAQSPRLQHLASRSRSAAALKEQIQKTLPSALAEHVVAAATRQGELSLWLDSGAFCARVRFEIPRLRVALVRDLGLPIERIRVRVQPRA